MTCRRRWLLAETDYEQQQELLVKLQQKCDSIDCE